VAAAETELEPEAVTEIQPEPEPGAGAADGDAVEYGSWVPREEGPRRRAGAWAVAVLVLVVLLIGAVAGAASYWSKASSASASANGTQAAESVAKTAVTDLITANYQDPSAYTEKIKQVAVGNFLNEFGNASAGFAKILVEGKVQTSGTIEGVGVEKFNGTTATLAVLAAVTVKNSQTPTGAQRVYRLRVSMVQSGSKWLVQNVEFVQ
jgi:Mce-associated membrane protein